MAQKKTAEHRIAKGTVDIVNDWGLHARPSAALAKMAQGFESEVTVRLGDKVSPALSVASLLMLEATKGSTLDIEAKGPDANEAIEAVTGLFKQGFGEEHIVLRGQGTRCGMVFGGAHVLLEKSRDIPHYTITKASVKRERARLDNALTAERKQINQMTKESGSSVASEFGELLMAIINDEHISKLPRKYIERDLINAEWALKASLDEILNSFNDSRDPFWESRHKEFTQVMWRLVKRMLKQHHRGRAKSKVGTNKVVVTSEIGPVEVLEFHRAGYVGFVSSGGSYNSHAAILARSLNLPAVVALEHKALEDIKEDTDLVVDSDNSSLHVKPNKADLTKMRKQARKAREDKSRKEEPPRVGGPPRTITRDGFRIKLMANIEFLDEVDEALASGAEGIGLFRTEFLYIGRKQPPDEEEQYDVYKSVIERNKGLPVTFRTIDIGHDKVARSDYAFAQDSALGIRAIRYCLREPVLFKEQLRALLRASEHGPAKIMFPLVSHQHEFEEAILLLIEAMRELNWDTSKMPKVGAMIEIPGSVFIMERLATNCDFYSIGSNDLIQYTLAVDRNIAALAKLADPCHPAIVWLLNKIIEQGRKIGKPVVMCGELASDIGMACLYCTLGLRELSMTASKISELRERLETLNISRCEGLAQKIVKTTSSREVRELIGEFGS